MLAEVLIGMSKPCRVFLIVCAVVSFFLVATTGYTTAQERDPRLFKQPHSVCEPLQAKDEILTAVGRFPTENDYPVQGNQEHYEVIAETRLIESPDTDYPEYGDPVVKIFDEKCKLLWSQGFPTFGEAGFELIMTPGQPILHVVARSVFQPSDDDLYINEIIYPVFNFLVSLAPTTMQSDRSTNTYVGKFGPHGEFEVISITNNRGWPTGSEVPKLDLSGLLYKWQGYKQVDGSMLYGFSGPTVLKKVDVLALHLPTNQYSSLFPLTSFVFPN
jgi:hypothetical protein